MRLYKFSIYTVSWDFFVRKFLRTFALTVRNIESSVSFFHKFRRKRKWIKKMKKKNMGYFLIAFLVGVFLGVVFINVL